MRHNNKKKKKKKKLRKVLRILIHMAINLAAVRRKRQWKSAEFSTEFIEIERVYMNSVINLEQIQCLPLTNLTMTLKYQLCGGVSGIGVCVCVCICIICCLVRIRLAATIHPKYTSPQHFCFVCTLRVVFSHAFC